MPVFPTVPRIDALKVQQKKGLHSSSLVIIFTEYLKRAPRLPSTMGMSIVVQ